MTMNPLLRWTYLTFGWLMVAFGACGCGAARPADDTVPDCCEPGALPALPNGSSATCWSTRISARPCGPGREKGAIPKRAKILSVSMMSVSFPLFLLTAHPSLVIATSRRRLHAGGCGLRAVTPDSDLKRHRLR